MGQVATALSNIIQGTVSNNIEKNLREQVLAIGTVEHKVVDTSSIKLIAPIQAYVSPIPFPQSL